MSSTPLSIPPNPSKRRRQSNSSVASSPNSQGSVSEGRTPHWQKSLSRKRAPTGLSLVTVAKPESGSILPSASDRLPRPRLMHMSSSSSLNEVEGRKAERADSMSIRSIRKKESGGGDENGRAMEVDEAVQRAMGEEIVDDGRSGSRPQGDEGVATRGASPGTKLSHISELDNSSPTSLIPTQPQIQHSVGATQQEPARPQAGASAGSDGEHERDSNATQHIAPNFPTKNASTSPKRSVLTL